MDAKELLRLKQLCESATPGPWKTGEYGDRDGVSQTVQEVGDSTGRKKDYPAAYLMIAGGWGYCNHANPNAEFIAAARTALPLLIEEAAKVPQLLAEQDRLLEKVKFLESIPGPVKIYIGDPTYKTQNEFILEKENRILHELLGLTYSI